MIKIPTVSPILPSAFGRHPLADVVDEFGTIYIQSEEVFVPSPKGKMTTIQTPKTRLTKPFESVGPISQFEETYFAAKNYSAISVSPLFPKPIPTNTIQNERDAFFHNVIEEYLTNKPINYKKITSNPKKEFTTNSPFRHRPTTILTPTEYITLGGLANAATESYLFQEGELFSAKSTQNPQQLVAEYEEVYQKVQSPHKTVAKFQPIYDTMHAKNYFGSNALPRKIEIFQNGNTYTIQTVVPKSHITAKGEQFAFDEVTLQTKVNIRHSHMSLATYPKAPVGYEHVFVYSNGEICFANENRFENIGMQTSDGYIHDITQASTVNKLKRVLDEGLLNLQFGDKKAVNYANSTTNLQHKRISQKTAVSPFAKWDNTLFGGIENVSQ